MKIKLLQLIRLLKRFINMGMGIRRTYFALPSIQNFTNNISDALRSGNNALVLLPQHIDEEDIVDQLQKILFSHDLDVDMIEMGSLSPETPVDFFDTNYPAKWESVSILRNANSYLERVEKIADAIVLSGFSAITKTKKQEWLNFLSDWAQFNHQSKNKGTTPPALCIVAKAEDILEFIPQSELCLSINWWWKIPSILEIKMLCRIINMDEDESNCLSEWRENVIPSLSLDNLNLIEFLWNIASLNSEKLIDELLKYSKRFGTEGDIDHTLQGLILEKEKRIPSIPPTNLQPHWAKGYISSTPEHGIELSTLALAKLGNRDELRHRIWRSQVDLLLPQIDNVRLIVCKHLTKIKGSDWPHKWSYPDSERQMLLVQENPLTTDLGYLNFLLSRDNHFSDCAQLKQLISLAHEIRNQIAHYQGVDFIDYEEFIQERLEALP